MTMSFFFASSNILCSALSAPMMGGDMFGAFSSSGDGALSLSPSNLLRLRKRLTNDHFTSAAYEP